MTAPRAMAPGSGLFVWTIWWQKPGTTDYSSATTIARDKEQAINYFTQFEPELEEALSDLEQANREIGLTMVKNNLEEGLILASYPPRPRDLVRPNA